MAGQRLATVQDVDHARRRGDRMILAILAAIAGLLIGGSVAIWRADQDRRAQAVALCEWVRVSAQRDAATASVQARWARETARLWQVRGEPQVAALVDAAARQEATSSAWLTQAAALNCHDPRQEISRLTTTTGDSP